MECEQDVNVADFAAFRADLIKLFTRYAQVAGRAPAPHLRIKPPKPRSKFGIKVPRTKRPPKL